MSKGQTRPNILFIFTDQHRHDWVEMANEVPVKTPNLNSISEEGVHFSNAICPTPVCGPARACIASGYEYERCGVESNNDPFPRDQTTYHERLRDESDYQVMGCGKFHIGKTSFSDNANRSWDLSGQNQLDEWGFSDGIFNAGKNQSVVLADGNPPAPQDSYMNYLSEKGLMESHINDYKNRMKTDADERIIYPEEVKWTETSPTPLPTEAYFDNWITRNSLSLLDEAPSKRPWFLQVNFQNPHTPWDVTDEMHQIYRNPDTNFPEPIDCDLDVAPDAHQEVRRNYAAMVTHLDRCFGRILRKLKDRGEYKNTLIVFSSDHGEMLGDYGQWSKMSPLQPSVGVPLIIAGPELETRNDSKIPVTTLDLHSTFLDFAGLPINEDNDSKSMKPYLLGDDKPPRDIVISELGPWKLVFDGKHKLIKGYDPDQRYSDHFEPMNVESQLAEKMRQERKPILYDVTESESADIYDSHKDIVRKFET